MSSDQEAVASQPPQPTVAKVGLVKPPPPPPGALKVVTMTPTDQQTPVSSETTKNSTSTDTVGSHIEVKESKVGKFFRKFKGKLRFWGIVSAVIILLGFFIKRKLDVLIIATTKETASATHVAVPWSIIGLVTVIVIVILLLWKGNERFGGFFKLLFRLAILVVVLFGLWKAYLWLNENHPNKDWWLYRWVGANQSSTTVNAPTVHNWRMSWVDMGDEKGAHSEYVGPRDFRIKFRVQEDEGMMWFDVYGHGDKANVIISTDLLHKQPAGSEWDWKGKYDNPDYNNSGYIKLREIKENGKLVKYIGIQSDNESCQHWFPTIIE